MVLIAAILIVFRYQYTLNGSTAYRIDALTGSFCAYPCTPAPTNPPLPATPAASPTPFNEQGYAAQLPSDERLAYAANARVGALQSTVSMAYANLGQRLTNAYFRSDHLIKDGQGFEMPDGTFWVVYSTCASEGAGCERYDLAILDGETLHPIWLPHSGGDWYFMEMLASSSGGRIVVSASPPETTFVVTEREIAQVPTMRERDLEAVPPRVLGDGSTCSMDRSPASPVFVWATSTGKAKRPLLSKTAFLVAAHDAIRLTDIDDLYCTSFQGVDLLVAGNGETKLTFVLAPPSARYAAPGEPIIMTNHHLLFRVIDEDAQGSVQGWGYAHITLKRF